MDITDISQLPLEVQNSVRTQMLVTQMNSYGKEIVTAEGFTGEKPHFVHLKNIKICDKFIELDKGCEMWIRGEKYPMRFVLQNNKIDTIHRFKKLIPTVAKSFKKSPILSVIYVLRNKEHYLDFLWYAMRDVYFYQSKYYSQSVREIHRVLANYEKIRDIVCAILEFDSAYRYRVQDIVGEIDKRTFETHPLKEINRLAVIIFQREQRKGQGLDKFRKLLPLVLVYLFFNRYLLGKIKETIKELDIDEMRLSKEDKYWSYINYDYDYEGISFDQRMKIRETL